MDGTGIIKWVVFCSTAQPRLVQQMKYSALLQCAVCTEMISAWSLALKGESNLNDRKKIFFFFFSIVVDLEGVLILFYVILLSSLYCGRKRVSLRSFMDNSLQVFGQKGYPYMLHGIISTNWFCLGTHDFSSFCGKWVKPIKSCLPCWDPMDGCVHISRLFIFYFYADSISTIQWLSSSS